MRPNRNEQDAMQRAFLERAYKDCRVVQHKDTRKYALRWGHKLLSGWYESEIQAWRGAWLRLKVKAQAREGSDV